MEGPFLAYKALLLIVLCTWIHRRFEKAGPADPAFERRVRDAPVVAALRARPGTAKVLVTALEAALPRDRVVLFGSGRRPWPWYRARIALRVVGDVVFVRVERLVVLRTRQADPPDGIAVLRGVVAAHGVEAWIDETTWVDLDQDSRPPGGFRLLDEGCEPLSARPAFAQPSGVEAAVAQVTVGAPST